MEIMFHDTLLYIKCIRGLAFCLSDINTEFNDYIDNISLNMIYCVVFCLTYNYVFNES